MSKKSKRATSGDVVITWNSLQDDEEFMIWDVLPTREEARDLVSKRYTDMEIWPLGRGRWAVVTRMERG